MNSRIRELKNRLKYKETELVSAKTKAARKVAEYNVVRCDPRIGWYGKNQCQKANRDCEYIQMEIENIKREIQRMEGARGNNNAG